MPPSVPARFRPGSVERTSTPAVSPDLHRAIAAVARTPDLLVVSNYDGVLAPIVDDFDHAVPLQGAIGALRELAGLPRTTVAVISGRALTDLATLSRLPAEILLLGSHGCETDAGFARDLTSAEQALHARLTQELTRLSARVEGARLEMKPTGIAVHLRRARASTHAWLRDSILAGPGHWDGIEITEAHLVIELSVRPVDRSGALDRLRHSLGASAVVFVGDDVTDHGAFSCLGGSDVGVQVGPSSGEGHFAVVNASAAADLLAVIAAERSAWIHGSSPQPIERLSMLASGSSLALVTPDARITWMCHPQPDSPAVFADLLGGPEAGHFTIGPARPALPLGQRYLPDTMIVQTRWSRLQVTDYLEHHATPGTTSLIRVITGDAPAVIEFAPRPEFGRARITLVPEGDGLRIRGTGEPMVLRSVGVDWQIAAEDPATARAIVDPRGGNDVILELLLGTDVLRAAPVPEPARRAATGNAWSTWVAALTLPNREPGLVARSALTLKGLCHAPTGAIMAAATTSLPEEIGGVRNWDYRYCWIRDAALTARALVSLGSASEARQFLTWLATVLGTLPGPERLQPLYTLTGAVLGPEAVIETLNGYAGSRPVRVGNLADQQIQLDVFGPVVDLVLDLAARTGVLPDTDWEVVAAMAEAVERSWFDPDHGIWEERARPRHHVYSKVMCWVTIDRAMTLARTHQRQPGPTWARLRDTIAADVLARGWKPDAAGGSGAYTAAYDDTDLDAASLHIGLAGLIDADDPRFRATVIAVEAELRSGNTVYRYRRDDGLPGIEGGFHLCATWLIEAYLLCGRRDDAEELFSQLVSTTGPTGLLPEQYDPVAERSLGNHPQAYSHLGLIRCARLLDGEAARP